LIIIKLGGQLDELLASLAARCHVCWFSLVYCTLFIVRLQINMIGKLLRPVGPLQLDLVAWFARGSCVLELQSARLGQRPTFYLVNMQWLIR